MKVRFAEGFKKQRGACDEEGKAAQHGLGPFSEEAPSGYEPAAANDRPHDEEPCENP